MKLRLKEIRQIKGLKASDVAEKLSITKNSLSEWESGKRIPPCERIIQLADFYNVSVDYLLGEMIALILITIPSDQFQNPLFLFLTDVRYGSTATDGLWSARQIRRFSSPTEGRLASMRLSRYPSHHRPFPSRYYRIQCLWTKKIYASANQSGWNRLAHTNLHATLFVVGMT